MMILQLYLLFPPVLFCGELLTRFIQLFLVLSIDVLSSLHYSQLTLKLTGFRLEIHCPLSSYPVICGLVPSFLTHPLVSPGPLKMCFLRSHLFRQTQPFYKVNPAFSTTCYTTGLPYWYLTIRILGGGEESLYSSPHVTFLPNPRDGL